MTDTGKVFSVAKRNAEASTSGAARVSSVNSRPSSLVICTRTLPSHSSSNERQTLFCMAMNSPLR